MRDEITAAESESPRASNRTGLWRCEVLKAWLDYWGAGA
jgi:hypothetical protein